MRFLMVKSKASGETFASVSHESDHGIDAEKVDGVTVVFSEDSAEISSVTINGEPIDSDRFIGYMVKVANEAANTKIKRLNLVIGMLKNPEQVVKYRQYANAFKAGFVPASVISAVSTVKGDEIEDYLEWVRIVMGAPKIKRHMLLGNKGRYTPCYHVVK